MTFDRGQFGAPPHERFAGHDDQRCAEAQFQA